MTPVTPDRHGSAVIEFPNELEVLITREFDAPIALVFDVLTKPEHVRTWGATPPDRMLECSIDLRVEAVETMELHEADGVTTLSWRLAFRDKAGRDHMTGFDGQQDSLDEMEDILRSLLDLNPA